jgi:superfamily I DNA/RNA helicase
MTFQLSHQQNAVLDWIIVDTGSLNLIARAGCGKTFTLRQAVLQIIKTTPRAEIYVGAFNKAIAGEINEAVKKDFAEAGLTYDWKQVNVSTLHSAGFSAWRYACKNKDLKVSDKKVADIVATMAEERDNDQAILDAMPALCSLVSYAKQRGFGFLVELKDRSKWFDLIDHFGIDDLPEEVDMDRLVTLGQVALQRSIKMDYTLIDYDDMMLAPLVHGARFFQKDWVLIDEAQDTNPVRRALALKMLKPRTGRLIAVGDPAQAIYGFTGADADSLDQIANSLGSKTLPLNVTYRCPKAVVKYAQQWVPDITAHETAPEGEVLTQPLSKCQFTQQDAILSRLTKPLIELAYSLIRDGVACKVEGRDIGIGLKKLATRWKVKYTAELTNRLEAYREREVQKWQAKEREEKAQAVSDKVATLQLIIDKLAAEDKKTVAEVLDFIDELFGDNVSGVLTLATIHRSKGREWSDVYWYSFEDCPSKWARKQWQVDQEINLMYVAATRAQSRLIMVSGV